MIRLAVRAPAADGGAGARRAAGAGAVGVEQVDGDGFVEFAVYGAPGELPELAEGEADVGGVRGSR